METIETKRIDELDEAAELTGEELLVVKQNGATVRLTADQLAIAVLRSMTDGEGVSY